MRVTALFTILLDPKYPERKEGQHHRLLAQYMQCSAVHPSIAGDVVVMLAVRCVRVLLSRLDSSLQTIDIFKRVVRVPSHHSSAVCGLFPLTAGMVSSLSVSDSGSASARIPIRLSPSSAAAGGGGVRPSKVMSSSSATPSRIMSSDCRRRGL